MTKSIKNVYNKSQINTAGKNVRGDNYGLNDLLIIENWRASHNHILNTFQATLRNRCKGRDIIFAQRLKRRSTIFKKLKRESGMSLARMHDVAGCRLIFQDLAALNEYRQSLHKARFKHKRRKANEDAYNYIARPRDSGYRGIHDVYEYQAHYEGGRPWNELLIEIQYRTKYQHAWATAVEVAGLITGNHTKFDQGNEQHKEFFKLTSEIIARAYEGLKSCYPSLSNQDLIDSFNKLENDIHLLRTFEGVHAVNPHISRGQTVILFFSGENKSLTATTYSSLASATEEYFKLEKSAKENDDIVLVRAGSLENIRNAFRNYFSDTSDFVRLVTNGLQLLAVIAP